MMNVLETPEAYRLANRAQALAVTAEVENNLRAELSVVDARRRFDEIVELRDRMLLLLKDHGREYAGKVMEGLEYLAKAAELLNPSSLRGVRAAMQRSYPLAHGLADLAFGAESALRHGEEAGEEWAEAATLGELRMVELELTTDALADYVRSNGAVEDCTTTVERLYVAVTSIVLTDDPSIELQQRAVVVLQELSTIAEALGGLDDLCIAARNRAESLERSFADKDASIRFGLQSLGAL